MYLINCPPTHSILSSLTKWISSILEVAISCPEMEANEIGTDRIASFSVHSWLTCRIIHVCRYCSMVGIKAYAETEPNSPSGENDPAHVRLGGM